MQDYTSSGRIITRPISTHNLEMGTMGVIMKDNTYKRITLVHLNADNDWVVEGDYVGAISSDTLLLKFVVITRTESFPIGFKHWKKIIDADLVSKNSVSVIVKPHKFKPGEFRQICMECDGSFKGGKSQPYCKTCCHKLSIAYLDGDIIKKNSNFTKKFVEQVATESYEHGINDLKPAEFDTWLQDKLINGPNNT